MSDKGKKEGKKDEILQIDKEMLGILVKALQLRVGWMQIGITGGVWQPDPEHGKEGVGRLQISVKCLRCNVGGNATSAMTLHTPDWATTFVGPMESEVRDWWLDAHHLISDAGKALAGGVRPVR